MFGGLSSQGESDVGQREGQLQRPLGDWNDRPEAKGKGSKVGGAVVGEACWPWKDRLGSLDPQ